MLSLPGAYARFVRNRLRGEGNWEKFYPQIFPFLFVCFSSFSANASITPEFQISLLLEKFARLRFTIFNFKVQKSIIFDVEYLLDLRQLQD